ncbi:hypothetical protein DEO72_LG3g3121 [Vigna unguiculata]|uniref:Uncharacterized protein n=1 Tax=Vigna unguiculata TaxID=3917 RepID=A0A4D6LIP8_VIGUN|nr:hypothetical protein DEO72_LG3g3121 [Vigna unguiculata]
MNFRSSELFPMRKITGDLNRGGCVKCPSVFLYVAKKDTAPPPSSDPAKSGGGKPPSLLPDRSRYVFLLLFC